MKTKVVTGKGGVYEYPHRLAEQLVRLGRVQFYSTRDMRAAQPVRASEVVIFENADEVDSAGAAYDPEQHSADRKKKSDGTWVKRPGRRAAVE